MATRSFSRKCVSEAPLNLPLVEWEISSTDFPLELRCNSCCSPSFANGAKERDHGSIA